MEETLQNLVTENGGDNVANVQALLFIILNESAMELIAYEWCKEAEKVGRKTNFDPIMAGGCLWFMPIFYHHYADGNQKSPN